MRFFAAFMSFKTFSILFLILAPKGRGFSSCVLTKMENHMRWRTWQQGSRMTQVGSLSLWCCWHFFSGMYVLKILGNFFCSFISLANSLELFCRNVIWLDFGGPRHSIFVLREWQVFPRIFQAVPSLNDREHLYQL